MGMLRSVTMGMLRSVTMRRQRTVTMRRPRSVTMRSLDDAEIGDHGELRPSRCLLSSPESCRLFRWTEPMVGHSHLSLRVVTPLSSASVIPPASPLPLSPSSYQTDRQR